MPPNEFRLLGNAPPSNAPFAPRFLITHLALPAGAALIISSLLMDGGGDFWVADHLYRLQGSRWALRDAWLTSNLLHRGGKNLSTFLAIAVAATCIWAWRKKRSNKCAAYLRWPLLYLFCAYLIGALTVSALKSFTNMDCPWNLVRYGGARVFVGLFETRPLGMPRGVCFPAGHASAGYAWVSLYFFTLMVRPAWRWMALAASLMIGAIFGWTQQVRGAHFLSHDLWTLLICWVVALGLFMVWQRWFVDGSGDVYSSGFQA